MLRRSLTALALLVIGLPTVILGGPFFFVIISIFLAGAAREYVEMFRAVDYQANETLTIGGVFLILSARAFIQQAAVPVFGLLVLAAMVVHVIEFERGRNQAALDFAVTISALVYVGWIGSYLMDLRNMPDGGWWAMIVLPVVWLTDTGAYSIGAAYGRHKMTPRLSPKKTWEGFAAGVFTSVISGMFFVFAYKTFAGFQQDITIWQGALLGLLIGLLTPLGDLGESMLKRQAHFKDSSDVFPGHGGFFDRIDSWIWAAVIGYYFIQWFILK
ncbi:MAG TPA: phosphatidate cytidylyltransferase [Anaerolineales bacterium]|nr:phosphatidate cytidylyltransferase [Anaerolineales bacterium]